VARRFLPEAQSGLLAVTAAGITLFYAAIAIGFAQQNLAYVSELLPWWLTLLIIAAGLVLALIKQESVSRE